MTTTMPTPLLRATIPWMALMGLLLISGCSGSTSEPPTFAEQVAESCIPDDPSSAAECGTLLVGLTDADGDFLSYIVDVVSLELVRDDGTTVETLPNRTRIDFAQYVDLTEFVAAATVPPGTYESGKITLDYSTAEVYVELGDGSVPAVVMDNAGAALGQVTLNIHLADRDRLLIHRGRSSLLTVDFDLAASHAVNTDTSPAIAVAEPFIVAEINPVDEKAIRARGPLVSVAVDSMTYTVGLRPFHDRTGEFGNVDVHITEATEFEVNESLSMGAEGLTALEVAGVDTPTVSFGTLNITERKFTADLVLAGDSMPGHEHDAAKGNVIARDGDTLTVRGATIILSDGSHSFYRDDVAVSIGPDTRVFKRSHDGLLGAEAISIGQRVTIRGEVTVDDERGLHLDATNGSVRMHITQINGVVNTLLPGYADIMLHTIDRRRASTFDFSGSGVTDDGDADPANYEVATGSMLLDSQSTSLPIVFYGFPTEFGTAPADFEGRTAVDFVNVRSVLGIDWGPAGTTAPFLSIGNDGLVLDKENPDIDQRHHIKHGTILIDLAELPADTIISPRETDRMLFVIKTTDGLRLYAEFADFVNALMLELDGVTTVRSMYARGRYNTHTNAFTAYKIGIHLLEP